MKKIPLCLLVSALLSGTALAGENNAVVINQANVDDSSVLIMQAGSNSSINVAQTNSVNLAASIQTDGDDNLVNATQENTENKSLNVFALGSVNTINILQSGNGEEADEAYQLDATTSIDLDLNGSGNNTTLSQTMTSMLKSNNSISAFVDGDDNEVLAEQGQANAWNYESHIDLELTGSLNNVVLSQAIQQNHHNRMTAYIQGDANEFYAKQGNDYGYSQVNSMGFDITGNSNVVRANQENSVYDHIDVLIDGDSNIATFSQNDTNYSNIRAHLTGNGNTIDACQADICS